VRPICCPETPGNNYKQTICTNPEEQRPLLHRGANLKSQECKHKDTRRRAVASSRIYVEDSAFIL
jgi:hypothetical protein